MYIGLIIFYVWYQIRTTAVIVWKPNVIDGFILVTAYIVVAFRIVGYRRVNIM